jgi:hypothetical protein
MKIGVYKGWANFYVDDDPTKHETPETVDLRVGKHRVRFVNPVLRLEKTVTIDVPDHPDQHVEVLE